MHGRHGKGGFGKCAKLMKMVSRLDLTPEQSQQMHQVFKTHAGALVDVMWPMTQARRELRHLYKADAPADEQAVRSAANKLGQSIAGAVILRSQLRSNVMKILTPEQVESLKKMRSKKHHRGTGHGECRAGKHESHGGHGCNRDGDADDDQEDTVPAPGTPETP
jgi:Spy/CpxP family protein refolding chaperone